jgi:hypothetical protein
MVFDIDTPLLGIWQMLGWASVEVHRARRRLKDENGIE